MRTEQCIKKVHERAAVIERLWRTLWNLSTCRIPASEARLFGPSVIVFESLVRDLKDFEADPETITSNKEKTGEAVFDAVISAATIFRYISRTLREQESPMALLMVKGIQEELFSMMETCQNFIMKE